MNQIDGAENVFDLGTTVRLLPFHPEQAAQLHDVFRDREVRRYLLDGTNVEREWVDSVITDSQVDFGEGRGGMWSIVRGGDEQALVLTGFVGVRDFFEPPRRQLVYGLHPEFWGHGLATMAVRRVLRFLFEELGWERVEAATDEPNVASVKVLERLGFESFVPQEPPDGGGDFGQTLFFELARARWRGPEDQAAE